jgi:hypothetical protein
VVLIATAFMAYKATEVRLSYEFAQMLPETDSTHIYYKRFKETFGEDGSVMFVGIRDNDIWNLESFNAWYDLTYKIKSIEGIDEVVSLAKAYHLVKNDEKEKFEFVPIIQSRPQSQEEVDSIRQMISSSPFYEGLLYNSETNATLMLITLDKDTLNTGGRVRLINHIQGHFEEFSEENDIKCHYSGLPYIRTKTSEKIQNELLRFIVLAMVIASIILLLFFRSVKAVFFTMVIVGINVIWILGLMSVFNYEITILTGILPPLLIVIVVENCIFLLNKYHNEFLIHGNKVKALSRMVQRIGNANLLTNATTAAGFAAFIITGNRILVEFGIISSISIIIAYLLTLFLIPITFSFLNPPKKRHIRHLKESRVSRLLERITRFVETRRRVVYLITGLALVIGITGITQLKATGNIVDDISKRDPLSKDLMFLEKHFKGVMPFEITIDTRKKRGVVRLANINKIEELQQILAGYPELSKPLSVAEVVKLSRQAFYKGNISFYGMPNQQEMNFMVRYLPDLGSGSRSIIRSFVDSTLQVTRISTQMANIGTNEIQRIKDDLKPRIDSVFSPDRYDVRITGTSIVFLEGTQYLVRNLAMSLVLALLIIAVLMALLFTSTRMILISLVPNLIPQIMTAGMMGLFAITIKPSTILIFSIALGISVDNAIHFLSRYRLYLRYNNWQIKSSIISALKETGYSMIYSSVVLFFGFAIFITSSFGGTQALGYLISFTLVMALLSNIFVLPSLLLSLNKRITTKTFSEPLLDIFDEEIDIEIEELEIEGIDTRGSA